MPPDTAPRRDDHLPSRPSRTPSNTTPGEAARAMAAAGFHTFRGDTDLLTPATELILDTAQRADVAVVLTELARLVGALLHREAEGTPGTTPEAWAAHLLTRDAEREQRC